MWQPYSNHSTVKHGDGSSASNEAEEPSPCILLDRNERVISDIE
jgi:hypothetical protein